MKCVRMEKKRDKLWIDWMNLVHVLFKGSVIHFIPHAQTSLAHWAVSHTLDQIVINVSICISSCLLPRAFMTVCLKSVPAFVWMWPPTPHPFRLKTAPLQRHEGHFSLFSDWWADDSSCRVRTDTFTNTNMRSTRTAHDYSAWQQNPEWQETMQLLPGKNVSIFERSSADGQSGETTRRYCILSCTETVTHSFPVWGVCVPGTPAAAPEDTSAGCRRPQPAGPVGRWAAAETLARCRSTASHRVVCKHNTNANRWKPED